MFIIIRHMTEAFGLFKDYNEALKYGTSRWEDGNFDISHVAEALKDVGLDFKEV